MLAGVAHKIPLIIWVIINIDLGGYAVAVEMAAEATAKAGNDS